MVVQLKVDLHSSFIWRSTVVLQDFGGPRVQQLVLLKNLLLPVHLAALWMSTLSWLTMGAFLPALVAQW